jgi:hypothetical protein
VIVKIYENGKVRIVERKYEYNSANQFNSLQAVDTVLDVRDAEMPRIDFKASPDPRLTHTVPWTSLTPPSTERFEFCCTPNCEAAPVLSRTG